MRPVTRADRNVPDEKRNDIFFRVRGFNGRITRGDYWMTGVVTVVGLLMLAVICTFLSNFLPERAMSVVVALGFICAYAIALMAGAKRCHDIGVSGWLQLVPFFGLVLLFKAGDKGPNEYGPDPLDNHFDDLDLRRSLTPYEQELAQLKAERDRAQVPTF